MTHRAIKISWFSGPTGFLCYGCEKPISTPCEFDVWWPLNQWRRYCDGCIRGVEMVYDYYLVYGQPQGLEINDRYGCVVYYDMETALRHCSHLMPTLEKI